MCLFVLLGAIVNVAVAWRYGMHWGFPELPMTSIDQGERSVVQVALFGVTLTERNLQTGSWESATCSIHQEMEAGVPFHSMRGSRTELGGATVDQDSVWEVSMPFLGLRTLPCGVLDLPASRSTRCSMRRFCGCCSLRRSRCEGGGASAAACARSAPTTCAAALGGLRHAPNAGPWWAVGDSHTMRRWLRMRKCSPP